MHVTGKRKHAQMNSALTAIFNVKRVKRRNLNPLPLSIEHEITSHSKTLLNQNNNLGGYDGVKLQLKDGSEVLLNATVPTRPTINKRLITLAEQL